MVIRAISGNDVTATRSVNGTSAATHLNGATVSTVAKNITLESISAGSSPNINSVRLYIEGSGTAAPAPTLGGDLSDSATSTTLSSTSNIERGDTLTINSEKVLVLGGVQTTLTSAINASVTTVPVTSAANFSAGDIIVVDYEKMVISSISGTDLTVTRGEDNTTADSHSNSSNVIQH